MAGKKKAGKKPIEQYDHKGKKRVNNPPVGLVTPDTDKETGKKQYAYDPHIDPCLQWAGKAEYTSFDVPNVSLHVHERIDPRTIIEAVRKRNGQKYDQLSLFAEAAKDIDETDWPGVTLLKAQMDDDLLTEDLKKKGRSNQSFWLVGQPDVRIEEIKKGEDKDKYRVEVLGFDYWNTKTGVIESGGTDKISMWMLDTDYDGTSLFPKQVFFPMSGQKDGWSRLAKNLKAEIDEELIEAYRGTISLRFEIGDNKRIAVKIVDDRGIESLKIMEVR